MTKFNQAKFESEAKKMVASYCEIDEKDVSMVWFSKVAPNAKAMLISDLNCRYYAVNYFGETGEYSLGVYDLVYCKFREEESNGESGDKKPTSGD